LIQQDMELVNLSANNQDDFRNKLNKFINTFVKIKKLIKYFLNNHLGDKILGKGPFSCQL